ncbi:hypothetical protein OIE66_37080 [Nonomuraea sp. NBC_01738]|nr:hypothetical protein OIE66_37080 [Nonomuraea sp. NBC_01738]
MAGTLAEHPEIWAHVRVRATRSEDGTVRIDAGLVDQALIIV